MADFLSYSLFACLPFMNDSQNTRLCTRPPLVKSVFLSVCLFPLPWHQSEFAPNPLSKVTCYTGLETGCKPVLSHSNCTLEVCNFRYEFKLNIVSYYDCKYFQKRRNLSRSVQTQKINNLLKCENTTTKTSRTEAVTSKQTKKRKYFEPGRYLIQEVWSS